MTSATAALWLGFAAQASAAASTAPPGGEASAALSLLILVAAVGGWLALRSFVRSLRARKTEAAVGDSFADFALEALVNAAKLDGRVNVEEQRAVSEAMRELAGAEFDADKVEPCFAAARLSKDELIAFLATRAQKFSREQKTALLKALLAVFVADGRFDETEHAALVDYTTAVGFDRRSAPEILRGLTRDFARGAIT